MKILLRGTNWIGDAVMSIPAMRALRRIFPSARISLAAQPWSKGVFEGCGFVDEVLDTGPGGSLRQVRAQAKQLRRHRFDLAVILPNSFRSALVAKLSGIGRRFGYRNEGRGFLLTDPIDKPAWKSERHEVFYYLNLVSRIEQTLLGTNTAADEAPRFELRPPGSADTPGIFRKFGIDPGDPFVVLGPGSKNSEAKRWPAERFARLNDLAREELGVEVILLGSAEENEVCDLVTRLSRHRPKNLCGSTSLPEAMSILYEASAIVSNDMGLAHIAAAMGTKTVTVFGPTDPKTTAPWNSSVVRTDVDCAPCMLRSCPIDHRCMTRISADEVFEHLTVSYDRPPSLLKR